MKPNIQITGRHVKVTPAIRQLTEQKLEKLLKHKPTIMSVHIAYSVENHEQKATAQLHIPHTHPVVVHASSRDLYKTIDQMIQRLIHQVEHLH